MPRTAIIALLVSASVTLSAAGSRSAVHHGGGTDACSDLALAVVDSAIDSLRAQPNQMSLRMEATGVDVSNTGGGTGINISPYISGQGSSFTGIEVKGVGNVRAIQNAANDVAEKQSRETVRVLEQIRDALQKRQESKLQPLLDTLKPIATDVVYKVVKTAVSVLTKATGSSSGDGPPRPA